MADDTRAPNSLTAYAKARSKVVGDVPDALRRQYLVETRAGVLGFYADATVRMPAFRDHGGRLEADRADPKTIRELAEIAQHRGWTIVVARGDKRFRREAWLAGRTIGLEVRGYRPTERDVQELDRRIDRALSRRGGGAHADPGRAADRRAAGEAATSLDPGQPTLRLVEAVVRNRVQTPAAQERMLAAARARIASWLERGPAPRRASHNPEVVVSTARPRERQR